MSLKFDKLGLIIALFVVIFVITLLAIIKPQPTDPELQLQKQLLHVFVQYELSFTDLNSALSQQSDHPYIRLLKQKDVLFLNLARASHALNDTLVDVQKNHPYLDRFIKQFLQWKQQQEQQLLAHQIVHNWRPYYIVYEYLLTNKLTNTHSQQDAEIFALLQSHHQTLFSDKARCQLLALFGHTQDPQHLSQQTLLFLKKDLSCRSVNKAETL